MRLQGQGPGLVPSVQDMIEVGLFVDVSPIVDTRRVPFGLVLLTASLHERFKLRRSIDNVLDVALRLVYNNGGNETRFQTFSDYGGEIDVKASLCSDGNQVFLIIDSADDPLG